MVEHAEREHRAGTAYRDDRRRETLPDESGKHARENQKTEDRLVRGDKLEGDNH